eukprot:253485_1
MAYKPRTSCLFGQNKILLPCQLNNKPNGDSIEISSVVEKLNSLHSYSHSCTSTTKFIRQKPYLSQSETDSSYLFDPTAAYVSTSNVDCSESSFKTDNCNSNSDSLPELPLPLPIPSISPPFANPYDSSIASMESNPTNCINHSANETITTFDPSGIDDVLMVFQQISDDVDEDQSHSHYKQTKQCKKQSHPHKRKCSGDKSIKHMYNGHNSYGKYTKHRRGNPFARYPPSK